MRLSSQWVILFCLIFSGVALADDLRIGMPLSSDSKQWEFVSSSAEKITGLSAEELAIKLVPYDNSEVGVATAIQRGELDGGLVVMKDFRELQLPHAALAFAVPFTFKSTNELDYIREKLDANILQKISTGPYEALAVMEFNFSYVMSSEVLATPDDWKKRKIWLPAQKDLADSIKPTLDALQLKMVPSPARDVKSNLQNGVLDTVITPLTVAMFKRWHTTIGEIFYAPFVYNYGLMIVRDDALQKLSPEKQQAARDYLALLGKNLSAALRERNDKALDVMDRRGIRFVGLDADMQKQWEAWGNKVWRNLADEYLPPRDIEEKLKELRKSFLSEKEMRQVSP